MNIFFYLGLECFLIGLFIVAFLFREEILWVCVSVDALIMTLIVSYITPESIIIEKIFFSINGVIFLLSVIFTVIEFVDKYRFAKTHNKIGDKKCY